MSNSAEMSPSANAHSASDRAFEMALWVILGAALSADLRHNFQSHGVDG